MEIIIEKDMWVTVVLRALFSLPYAEQISFKGGTSLSKCWNVIDRFSEDVDIAINREYFGFQGETFTIRQIGKLMRKACCKFCRDTLQFDLTGQMIINGIPENLFSVKMNINARSMKEPLEKIKIQSFIDKQYPQADFAEKPFEVQVVAIERTFLEKICLLHEEFAKKDREKIRVNRMSRHLYDIVMILDTPVAEKALNDTGLYKRIIAHRRMFQAIKDFDYDTLLPQTINIIPPDDIITRWEDDYSKMQTMIYGNDTPAFNTIINKIKQLNERINHIIW